MRSWQLVLLSFVMGFADSAAGDDAVRHRFLCVDNGQNRLIFVDQLHADRSWTTPIPAGSRDLQLLGAKGQPPDRILVSHGNGAAEYDLATGRPREWVVDRYHDIQTAVRLENGETWLGRVDGTLFRLDPGGKELAAIPPPIKMNIRLMRPTAEGHWLLGGAGPPAILELDPHGRLVRQVPIPGGNKGYKAIRLAKGTYLTGTGDGCTIVEVDSTGKVLSTVGGKQEHPQLGLDFCSGWDLLPNGNRLMANWLGHGKQGKGVHLAEFTADNRLVWQWGDHQLARQVTNVLVLE